MRTVMIVDDEKLVRIGLRTMIDWQLYGYEVIGVFKNGLEAWESISERAPDVLFTDIRMPKMDGLELIQKIKQAGISTHVVILSSHEDFQYTRRAIQLNVQDYLIKHELESEEIIQVLDQLMYKEETKVSSNARPLAIEKESFLMAGPSGDWSIQSFPLLFARLKDVHKAKVTKYAWIVFHLVPKKEAYHGQEQNALAALIDETLSRLNAVFLGNDNGCYHALLCLSTGPDQEERQQALKIAEEVIHTSQDNLNMKVNCGISTWTSSLEKVAVLRSEAEQALQPYFFHGPGIYFYDQMPHFATQLDTEWVALFHKAKELIANHHFERLCTWLHHQFHTTLLHVHPSEAIRFCEMVINNLIHYMLDQYQMDLIDHRQNVNLTEDLSFLRAATTWRDLYDTTSAIIRKCQAAINELKHQRGWIVQTIEYIKTNFDQPLRLEDVAGHVNFSVNYFCQRFHQETGTPFTDYIMRYRINKAKEYLLQGTDTTEEIAYKVGYRNTNYFVRVFKKVTGMTLSEFKRSI